MVILVMAEIQRTESLKGGLVEKFERSVIVTPTSCRGFRSVGAHEIARIKVRNRERTPQHLENKLSMRRW